MNIKVIYGVNLIKIDLIGENNIRKPEDSMSYNFQTNSAKFDIIFEITDVVKGRFPHTGITAREGIGVLYRKEESNNWYNIDLFYKENKVTINMLDYIEKGETYEIIIYGPIIAKISKLQIDILDEATISIPEIKNKHIAVTGGPISFGIGCTSTKSIFSNILERKTNSYVHHIAYNNFNYLESVYEYYNNNPPVTDLAILEIDYFPQKESVVEELLPKILDLMKQKCKYIIGWYVIPESKAFKKIIANNTIKKYIYDEDITVIDLSYILSQEYFDKCAYNNFVINDTGHMIIYKELLKEIRRITKWNI